MSIMLDVIREPTTLHVEGMDLSGKTTVAREVMKRAPFAYRHNNIASHEISKLGLAVDEMSESGKYSPTTISIGYVASILADIDSFNLPNKNTIQDSAAVIRCMSRLAVDNQHELFTILHDDAVTRHPRFTKSFYLTASIDERIRRLRNSENPSQNDLLLAHDTDKFLAMEEAAMNYSVELFDATIINTTHLDPREIAVIITRGT
jgi:thymidylate kinase